MDQAVLHKLNISVLMVDIRTYEEQIETMAFLKLINLGRKEIFEGKFQSAEDFF